MDKYKAKHNWVISSFTLTSTYQYCHWCGKYFELMDDKSNTLPESGCTRIFNKEENINAQS